MERSSIALLTAVAVGILAGCTPSPQTSVSSYASLEQKSLDAEKAEAEIANMIASHGKAKDEKAQKAEKAVTKAGGHESEKNAKKSADKKAQSTKAAAKAHDTAQAHNAVKSHDVAKAKDVTKTHEASKAKEAAKTKETAQAKATAQAKDKAAHATTAAASGAAHAAKPRQLASKPEATPKTTPDTTPQAKAEATLGAAASTAATATTAAGAATASAPSEGRAATAPAAAPAAPATTAVATAHGKALVYVVQIGAFRVKDNAERFQQKLKAEGFPVLMRPLKHSKNGELFLVRMEPTPNKTEAEEWVAQLKAKASLTSNIIALPEGD